MTEYHLAIKRNAVLTQALTCMNLKGITLHEISQMQRLNILWLYFHEMSRVAKIRETENIGCYIPIKNGGIIA
jgi:hypothetical protein